MFLSRLFQINTEDGMQEFLNNSVRQICDEEGASCQMCNKLFNILFVRVYSLAKAHVLPFRAHTRACQKSHIYE